MQTVCDFHAGRRITSRTFFPSPAPKEGPEVQYSSKIRCKAIHVSLLAEHIELPQFMITMRGMKTNKSSPDPAATATAIRVDDK